MSIREEVRAKPAPFLKWAGGKRALIPAIAELAPLDFGTYFEPFLGAGAVMFTQPRNSYKLVSDFNEELIETYLCIRDDLEDLIEELRSHVNTAEHYYDVRKWDRDPGFRDLSRVRRAARFIYLNKCGYNGLYRVNSKGQMNVPFGKQSAADWVSEGNLRAVNAFLRVADDSGNYFTSIQSGDYRTTTLVAGQGDWVYLDPPYAPLSPTSSFVSYSSDGFSSQDQIDLRDEILRLTEVGAMVLASNSDTPLIRDLYSDKSVFRVREVSVKRAIAAKSGSRTSVGELLISNY